MIDPAHEQKSQRVAEVRRAYGCRADDAREIAEGKTRFARGAQHFGPMFCWYVKDRYQWTLFGQPKSKKDITRAAKIPYARRVRRLRAV